MDAAILILCVLAALSAEHIPVLLAFTVAAGILTVEKEVRFMDKMMGEFLRLVRQLNETQRRAYLQRLRKKAAGKKNAAQVLAHPDGKRSGTNGLSSTSILTPVVN